MTAHRPTCSGNRCTCLIAEPSEADVLAAVLSATDRRHTVYHDPADVYEARRPSAEETEAIDLLELKPGRPTPPYVRLSRQQWRVVDRVAARLTPPAVPAPRASSETTERSKTA